MLDRLPLYSLATMELQGDEQMRLVEKDRDRWGAEMKPKEILPLKVKRGRVSYREKCGNL